MSMMIPGNGGDIKAPLLGKDGANTVATSVISDFRDSTITREPAAAKPTQSQLINLVAVGLVTTAAVAASISALVLVPAAITIVAGCICLLNSPIVMYKAKKLLVLPSLRKDVDNLQHTKQLLKRDRKKLQEEVKSLDAQKRRYAGVERQLQHIALSQGTSIDVIIGLVKDNEETLDLMRDNLRQKVIEDIIGILIKHESNTQYIDKVEAQLLALKISVKLEAYGVSFNEAKFSQAVALNPTLAGVIGTTRKLLPLEEKHAHDEELFESDIYDMFYIRTEDGSIWASTASYASFSSEGNGISLARTIRRPRFRFDDTSDNLSV
ncbi:hypothetical protein ACHAWT_009208 [Skeletonema menzelii]